MRRLYILRHAEAVSAPEDRMRPLSTRGRNDAEILGQKMKQAKMFPDYVVCSPARRTRETHAILEKILPETACIYPEYLYNAGLEDLVHGIRALTSSVHAVLIVGHNPGLHTLALSLSREGDAVARSSLSYGLRPGAMAVIDCDIEDWEELSPSRCSIVTMLGT